MEIIEQAEEILKKPIGWIELDLEINLDLWRAEAAVAEKFLVHHREGENHIGWKSCCLHGISIDKTGHWSKYFLDEKEAYYDWTSLADITPTITNFWKSFPTEKFVRLRFMELEPYGVVAPHSDAPNGLKNTDFNMMDHMIPINVAITHPDGCEMHLGSYGKVPWKSGKLFVINITDTHQVINNSRFPRMHMIAHCIIGNRKKDFAEMIVRSYNKTHGHRI
jgi:hypothetical protein